jgi:Phage integrase, N-terminal SAM-like domain.
VFADYEKKVARAGGPLDANSVRVYRSRVRQYLAWLATALADGAIEGDPLTNPDARDWAVRDYRAHLQTVAKRKPSTINAHLTAVDDFYRRRGLGPAAAERADIPQAAPRALDKRDQLRLLREADRAGRGTRRSPSPPSTPAPASPRPSTSTPATSRCPPAKAT